MVKTLTQTKNPTWVKNLVSIFTIMAKSVSLDGILAEFIGQTKQMEVMNFLYYKKIRSINTFTHLKISFIKYTYFC